MKTIGACCTWRTFWDDGFVTHWRRQFVNVPIPDYIQRKAKHFWKVYSMTGYEAFKTIEQDEDLGQLPVACTEEKP